MKYAADDDHGVRPHDVNHGVSSNSREIVGADHYIVVAPPYIVHTRFELNQVVHMRPAAGRPFHVTNDAAERKTAVRVAARQLLEKLQHAVLIEVTVRKICFGIGPKLELAAVPGGRRIDACRSQALQMIVMLPRTYNVDGLISALKAVLYEWQQHAVLFIVAVEKRTDVTYVAQLGTGKGNWRRGLFHAINLVLLGIARQRRRLATAFIYSMLLRKTNVYQTLVSVWLCSRHGPPRAMIRNTVTDRPTPTCYVDRYQSIADTFVQLFWLAGYGLIANRDGVPNESRTCICAPRGCKVRTTPTEGFPGPSGGTQRWLT